jgi:large subunit ribosomal protein L6
MPISLPSGVKVDLELNSVTVEGPKGKLNKRVPTEVNIAIEDSQILLTRPSDSRRHKALHGLTRSIINNMVIGVTDGFEKRLRLVGIGRDIMQVQNNKLTLKEKVFYSHPVTYTAPEGISISLGQEEVVEKLTEVPIIVSGMDKELVGEVAAAIRRIKKPEYYKPCKGIRYESERVRNKETKAIV